MRAFRLWPPPGSRVGTGSIKWDRFADASPGARAQGKSVLPLWVADGDMATAPAVLQALQERVGGHGVFGYAHATGEENEAVLRYLRDRHATAHPVGRKTTLEGLGDPKCIVWLPGLVNGLALAARAYANVGEAVMSCTPVYPPFHLTPGYSGRVGTTVPLIRPSREAPYTFDFPAMRRRCEDTSKPRVRSFVLCNPHNPVGRVFDREELLELLAFARQYNLVVVSDEVHSDLVLPGKARRHTSLLEVCNAEDLGRVVILNSPSKTFNIAGLCTAYAIALNEDLRRKLRHEMRGGSDINALGFVAMRAAYERGEEWRQGFLKHIASQVAVLSEVLLKNEGCGIRFDTEAHHDATYLAWLDCSETMRRQQQRRTAHAWFLGEAGVAVNDGVTFFGAEDSDAMKACARGFVRLNLACHESTLREALGRMVAEAAR